MVGNHAAWSRPFGATMCKQRVEQLGGRSCGSAKLVAGTLRCLRLCWGLPWSWSPVKQLGRCPKPHKGESPLDPFARLSWSHSHALPACLSSFSLPLIVIGERGEIPPRQLHQFTHRHRAQSLYVNPIIQRLIQHLRRMIPIDPRTRSSPGRSSRGTPSDTPYPYTRPTSRTRRLRTGSPLRLPRGQWR